MNAKKGFTLMELLIAAAIIGTLAIFAMQSFRSTSSEIRVQDAISRAKIVAMAAHRFWMDHPAITQNEVDTSEMGVVANPRTDEEQTCVTSGSMAVSLQNLINCGYLEFRQYASEVRDESNYKRNFSMEFYPKTVTSGSKTVLNKIWVHVAGATAKITDANDYYTDGESVQTTAP